MVLVVDARKIAGADGQQEWYAPGSEDQPENSADSGKKNAFGEQLADQMAAAGANGGTDGDFALASGGAREQEIGDVGTGDEQNEAHSPHQNQQSESNIANQRVAQEGLP